MGISEWTIVDTPDSIPDKTREILNPLNLGSGIVKIAVSYHVSPIWAIVRRGDRNGLNSGGSQLMLYMSSDIGTSWTDTPYRNLSLTQSTVEDGTLIWDIAIAPDDPKIIVVACSNIRLDHIKQEIWLSTDQGTHWENTHWTPLGDSSDQLVSAMAISIDYGDRKIIVGTRNGTGRNNHSLYITQLKGYGGWNVQNGEGNPPSKDPITGDILAAKFSPTFAKDNTIIILYSNGIIGHEGTWLAMGTHDTSRNFTKFSSASSHVEIKNSDAASGDSAKPNEIITANIELPVDFSGEDISRRHVYISIDADDRIQNITPNRGIYRVVDKDIYTLMDNTTAFGYTESINHPKRVSSIAFFGTCSAGKLMVGEVFGYANTCTVPTWFTDAAAIYPIPCWYPALKPATGAGHPIMGQATHEVTNGYGNVIVVWSPIGEIAYAATSAASLGPWAPPIFENGMVIPDKQWPAGFMQVESCDESAFSISRNNGETWNQLGLVNTQITKLTDIAPSQDNTSIYLASFGESTCLRQSCSIWRSSINPNVTAPLPASTQHCGRWERVFLKVHQKDNVADTFLPVLRLVDSCTDKPDGEIIAFSLMGTNIMAWSPDFGDYWANIAINEIVQDFCFESSSTLHVLTPSGKVHNLFFTGTLWSTKLPLVDTHLDSAHTIVALPDRKVLVGASKTSTSRHKVAYSIGNDTFVLLKGHGKDNPLGDIHVAFDPDFRNNRLIYINDQPNEIKDSKAQRNQIWKVLDGIHTNIINRLNKRITDSPPYDEINHYGIVMAKTGVPQPALYSAHDSLLLKQHDHIGRIYRTMRSRDRASRSIIHWACLKDFDSPGKKEISFSLEPSSLKCSGCCTLDTHPTLYAIDNDRYSGNHNIQTARASKLRTSGMLWSFTDVTAKGNRPSQIEYATIEIPTIVLEPKPLQIDKAKLVKEADLRKIIIYTEGKTDEKILKTAWARLNSGIPCPYTIIKCDPDPEGSSGGSGGCAQLAKTLSGHHPIHGSTVIGIFDREEKGINEFNNLEVKSNFAKWNNRLDVKVSNNKLAYALLLPIPPFRSKCAELKNLSIEFMFPDSAIKRLSYKEHTVVFNLRINSFSIPDNLINELRKYIPKQLYEDCRRFTDASKSEFANKIVPCLSPSVFKSFGPLFDLIKQITG